MADRIISLALSFFIAGLGIAYEGNLTLGVGVILLWSILCLVALYSTGAISMIVGVAAFLVWGYSFIETILISAPD